MALLNRFKSKLSSAITEAPEEEDDVEELAEDDDKGWSVSLIWFQLNKWILPQFTSFKKKYSHYNEDIT